MLHQACMNQVKIMHAYAMGYLVNVWSILGQTKCKDWKAKIAMHEISWWTKICKVKWRCLIICCLWKWCYMSSQEPIQNLCNFTFPLYSKAFFFWIIVYFSNCCELLISSWVASSLFSITSTVASIHLSSTVWPSNKQLSLLFNSDPKSWTV